MMRWLDSIGSVGSVSSMRMRRRAIPKFLVVNSLIAGTVICAWFFLFGGRYFGLLAEHWPVAITMVFGSLVGGGTSEGGGAVGFPVLTKVLEVDAPVARVFTFAVQSVGMVGASLAILICRVPIERRVLLYGGAGGIAGVILSIFFIAPLVPATVVRVMFTMILVSLAVALAVQILQRGYSRNQMIPMWGRRERSLVVLTGFGGGLLSGVAGVGENTVMFILLVLLFRVCEKISTPTTVILMAMVSVAAFVCHIIGTRQFAGVVVEYWIVAAPVCAVGAPLGAWICSKLKPMHVRAILWLLITVELISTLLIIPLDRGLLTLAGGGLFLSLVVCAALITCRRYENGARNDELL